MKEKRHLNRLFKDCDPEIRELLRKVIRIEQRYITDPLKTNSFAHKELRQKIDKVLEDLVKE